VTQANWSPEVIGVVLDPFEELLVDEVEVRLDAFDELELLVIGVEDDFTMTVPIMLLW